MAVELAAARPWLDRREAAGDVPEHPPAADPRPPLPENEPLRYAAGSDELRRLASVLRDLEAQTFELPLVIGGQRVYTGETADSSIPHRKSHVLTRAHQADATHVAQAIEAARTAWQDWHRWPWHERAAMFLRAAELAAGPYRDRLTAATMLDQSKTVYEAEGDAVCELCDLFRFNVHQLRRLIAEQPASPQSEWNYVEYRALEGFVYAVTPFNFTAIGANLPSLPALLGNVSVWKPSPHATLGAAIVMELLAEAGLPDGVINLVHGDASAVTDAVLESPDFAGLHFTGSTHVFRDIWAAVGARLHRYRNYPRLVGETGGKDFVVAHASADLDAATTAVVRGAFEYQGQKCSAASRVYAAASVWPELSERLREAVRGIRMGDPADFGTYMAAVISEPAFARHREAIAEATAASGTRILAGGGTDDGAGWFVEPTVVETDDPGSGLLHDELFGPVVTTYVFDDAAFDEALELVDRTSQYALTGSIFANDRRALGRARARLRYAAGNLSLNDKPTGAVVGRQPFGGARGSGTNDKSASPFALARWSSPLTVKDSLSPERHVPYPQA